MDYYVRTGYAVGMVRVENGVVTLVAPIFRWMHGKPWSTCKDWIDRKGFDVEEMP